MIGSIARKGLFLSCVCLLAVPALNAAELRLDYAFMEETESFSQPVQPTKNKGEPPAQSPKSVKKSEQGKLSIIIGKTYFVFEKQGTTQFFDLQGKRLFYRAAPNEKWKNSSLYADVFFRVMEFQNRQMIGSALKAAGVSDPIMSGMRDTFDLEALFGLCLPNSTYAPAKDVARQAGEHGDLSFTKAGEELASFRPSSVDVPASFRAQYACALTHLCRLHPELRREIARTGKVPQTLRTHWLNTGMKGVTTWTLESTSTAEQDSYAAPAPDQQAAKGERDPMEKRKQEALRQAQTGQGPSLATMRKVVGDAVANGTPLDGILAIFELSFQTQVDVALELGRVRDAAQKDPACLKFFAATNQSDKESCEKAITALRSIERKNLTKGYVLDIHIADALSSLGKAREAEQLFLSVLDHNPLLVGVWNDLGQLYSQGYEMDKAWDCWDLARQLAPNHPMLANITQTEHRLEHDFPDFFLPAGN